jgi:hypothetical protein
MVDKREQLWRQRWTREEQVLGEQGVTLKSWRVGADAVKVAEKLIKEQLEREKKGARNGR